MREILFRFVFKNRETGEIRKEIFSLNEIQSGCAKLIYLLRNSSLELIARDEFTGITDKNGKKIFENDIVKSDWGYGELNTKVEFQDIFFADNECTISENIEVIGNIFDNPDLLDGSK